MKKLRYYIIACTASLAFLTACDNAEYNVIDNAIYWKNLHCLPPTIRS